MTSWQRTVAERIFCPGTCLWGSLLIWSQIVQELDCDECGFACRDNPLLCHCFKSDPELFIALPPSKNFIPRIVYGRVKDWTLGLPGHLCQNTSRCCPINLHQHCSYMRTQGPGWWASMQDIFSQSLMKRCTNLWQYDIHTTILIFFPPIYLADIPQTIFNVAGFALLLVWYWRWISLALM